MAAIVAPVVKSLARMATLATSTAGQDENFESHSECTE